MSGMFSNFVKKITEKFEGTNQNDGAAANDIP